jgi:hypothetical protein
MGLTGQTLGPFTLEEQIGMGGMATVYKAYDAGTDRYVAVKVLPHQYSGDPKFVERFRREVKAIAKLEHPYILPVHHYGEDQNTAYLVMRYMDGGTLGDKLKKGLLPVEQATRLIRQIGDALDYAHQHGILHRDVKPSNVLLDNQDNAFLMDFGIAKMMEGMPDLTGTGLALGTPQYMSPEQCMGSKDLTPATDVYALGVVLYQMVTGQLPFHAETPLAVIHMQLNAPLPPPRSVNPELPEWVERVIFKSMAKDPEDRYQSCGDMATAMEQAQAGGPMPAPPPSAGLEATIPDAISPPATPPPVAPPIARPATPPPVSEVRPQRRFGMRGCLIIGGIAVVGCAAVFGGLLLLGVIGSAAADPAAGDVVNLESQPREVDGQEDEPDEPVEPPTPLVPTPDTRVQLPVEVFDAIGGFSMNLPAAWASESDAGFLIAAQDPDAIVDGDIDQLNAPAMIAGFAPAVDLAGEDVNTVDDLMNLFLADIDPGDDSMTVGAPISLTLSGFPATSVDLSGYDEDFGSDFEGQLIAVIADYQAGILLAVAPQGQWADFAPTFEAILDTVQIFEPSTPAATFTSFIEIGETTSATLEDDGVHEWQFIGSAGDILGISVAPSDGDLDLVMRIYGPDGTLLEDVDEGFSGELESIGITLPDDGTYTVVVAPFAFGGGRYSISISG